jgi:bifunctional DNA-binding transcriptional regulator/antitoxin component of YhaV-PrlF toxin-antitoxin module
LTVPQWVGCASFLEVWISGFRNMMKMGAIVKLQRKGQLTIPRHLRAHLGLVDGGWVGATAEQGKIVLTPKLIVDRTAGDEYTPAQRRAIDARLAESLEQARSGETYGPFETHEEMTALLHSQARKARTRKTRSVDPSAR